MVSTMEGDQSGRVNRYPAYLAALVCGLAAFLLLPGPHDQRATLGVFVVTVVLWLTEALPLAVTAVGACVFLVLSGATDAKSAFASLGDPVIFLFVGSFILAKGLETSGLANRMAYSVLRQPVATRTLSSLLLSIALVACTLSLFISNTATTVMLLPVVKTVLEAMGRLQKDGKETSALLLMTSWASGIAVGTMVATPPNLIGIAVLKDLAGVDVNFVQFAFVGMPVTLVLVCVAWMMLRSGLKGSDEALLRAREKADREMSALGPMDTRQKVVGMAFAVAVVLWLVPGLLESFLPPTHLMVEWTKARMPESIASLVGAGLLFVIPIGGGRPAVSWKEAAQIDWGTILLFAGGLALGGTLFKTGLASRMGEAMAQVSGDGNIYTVTALVMVAALVISELASNTAAATVVIPISIALSDSAGVNPALPAMGATLACSLGYMLPVSTPPNAVVFSTGYVSGRRMMRSGFWFDAVCLVVTYAVLVAVAPFAGLV